VGCGRRSPGKGAQSPGSESRDGDGDSSDVTHHTTRKIDGTKMYRRDPGFKFRGLLEN